MLRFRTNAALFHCLWLVALFVSNTVTCSEASELRVLSDASIEEQTRLAEAFEADTGIKIRWAIPSSERMFKRGSENTVIYPASSDLAQGLRARGLLLRVQIQSGHAVCNNCTHPDGYWAPVYHTPLAFLVAPDTLAYRGIRREPSSWRALVGKQYRNSLAFPSPNVRPTGVVAVRMLEKLFGKREAVVLFKELNRNIRSYNVAAASCIAPLLMGDIPVCITFAEELGKAVNRQGVPTELIYPSEGTGFITKGVVLLRGSGDPENAKRFIDWILGERAQQMLSQWGKLPLDTSLADYSLQQLAKASYFYVDEQRAGLISRQFLEVCKYRRC